MSDVAEFRLIFLKKNALEKARNTSLLLLHFMYFVQSSGCRDYGHWSPINMTLPEPPINLLYPAGFDV
jgi:hypothetical protein